MTTENNGPQFYAEVWRRKCSTMAIFEAAKALEAFARFDFGESARCLAKSGFYAGGAVSAAIGGVRIRWRRHG